MKKICIVTGTRAEYGLLRHLMRLIAETPGLALQVIVTGMHLETRYGETWREIEADGFRIDRRVAMSLDSDTPVGLAHATGRGTGGFADAYQALEPDLVVVLGDRFELLSAVIPAIFARIPVAHIHGGELTEGAIDEAIRHAITKISHLHFVAAGEYRRRVIQMGEDPGRVFLVGGLGVDAIKRVTLLDRSALEADLGVEFLARNLLVTFHPVTLERGESARQFAALLDALSDLQDTRLILTMPNADTENHALAAMVQDFAARHPNVLAVTSLGQLRYLSCLAQVDGVVGNSSSGIAEAPSFRIGTVDIGDRQRGRLKAQSVIQCEPTRAAIGAAIARLYDPVFRKSLETTTNPYGDGGAAARILAILSGLNWDGLLKKRFHDMALPPDLK